MGRSKPNYIRGWTNAEREFCVEQYYLLEKSLAAVLSSYSLKFRVYNGNNVNKCPTKNHVREWVKLHEEKQKSALSWNSWKQTEEQQNTVTTKLSGTQWGRKTGENRIIRTESVDMGQQHQEIKWRQRNIKWSGPRPVNEKQIIEKYKEPEPIAEEKTYHSKWYLKYLKSLEEEVKPTKEQVLKEKYEGEVLELIESLDAHGHAARAGAFVSLRAALQRRAVDGLLAAHRATLADHVAGSLRRGKDDERKEAAATAPLLAIQIGEDGMEQFVREVRPALTATATDKTASLDTRAECCSSLAVLCYLMEDDVYEILEVMRMYETIFSGSYLKVSEATVEEGAWHAAALDGWALLLPMLPRNHALSLLNNQAPSFTRLGELLEAVSLEVRMAAGGALAIAYETVTDNGNSYNSLTPYVDELLPRLTELAQDNKRSHAKRDKKIQRATFREILKYFEEGEAPCTSAHIGTETAVWSGWWGGAAYAALAAALGGALQVLAPHCPRLRSALQMSTELPEDGPCQEKPKKLQRQLQKKATSKTRSFTRNRNRDKRTQISLSM